MLEILGIGTLEETLYRTLIELGGASTRQLAEITANDVKEIRAGLTSLVEKGLVTRSNNRPVVFAPVAPSVSLRTLIHRKEEELEAARAADLALGDKFQALQEQRGHSPVVEVVVGNTHVCDRFLQLLEGAEKEFLNVSSPPYSDDPSATQSEREAEDRALARKVECRIIYDVSALDAPGDVEIIGDFISRGEQARFVGEMPHKLAIADRSIGLVPLDHGDSGLERALVIQTSPLLDCLVSMFEMLWDRSKSTLDPFGAHERERERERELAEGSIEHLSLEDRELLRLLASGMKDDAIARHLRISTRTVVRRVNHVMKVLEARTRLQLGIRIGELGSTKASR